MKISSLLLLSTIIIVLSCNKDNENAEREILRPVDTLSSGWQKINTGISAYINDVWFFNAANGLLCTNSGIYYSVDSGKTWNLKSSVLKNYINLFFVNNLVGFAQKRDSISTTTDGGSNWITRKLPRSDVQDIQFITPSTGFAFGSGVAYKTVDTAKTWTQITANGSLSVFFIDQLQGYMHQADGYIYSSVDGGATWQKKSNSNVSMGGIDYLFFSDINTGWLVNFGYGLFKTSNGGLDWANVLPVNSATEAAIDCFFSNNEEGMVSSTKRVFSTSNSGGDWKTEVIMHTKTVGELYFLNMNTGWVCCSDGVLLRFKK